MTKHEQLPVLDFLKRYISDPEAANTTHMRYPNAISKTLQFTIGNVDKQRSVITAQANPNIHGNQQGIVHGGFICEVADAPIGTAHSTIMQPDQSFTTIELKMNFIRPSWQTLLRAEAISIYSGKTLTHYQCQITNEDEKLNAIATSIVMTLYGQKATAQIREENLL